MSVPVAKFQAECARLQKGIILEKCRLYLLTSGPADATWKWCAEYVSKYGDPVTPTTSVVRTSNDERPIEAVPLSARVRAVKAFLAERN